MPNARKLPSGNYRVQIYIGTNDEGKRVYKSFTASTKRAAEILASEWLVSSEDKKDELIKEPPKCLTLGEAMDKYINTCIIQDFSPSTINSYDIMRRNSYPLIIDVPIDEISSVMVQDAINYRTERCLPKSVKNDFFFLHRVMHLYRPSLDLSSIILPSVTKRPKLIFKKSWASQILQYARHNLCIDFYIYCSFIISTGARPSEVHALKYGNLSAQPIIATDQNGDNYSFGKVHIGSASVINSKGIYVEKKTKTAAGKRTLTVEWSFFEDLYSVKPRGKDYDRVVNLTPRNCDDYWAKLRKALSLPDEMRFYDLRHFFATSYTTSGATDDELASAMGHTTATFTHNTYVERFEDRIQKINANLANETAQLYRSL